VSLDTGRRDDRGDEFGRLVTLVLVDAAGSLLGTLEPFRVKLPYWPETEEIEARHPDVTVLRLLESGPNVDNRMGGAVTYLAQLGGEVPAALRPYGGPPLADAPARMPWASPGGPARDLAWAAALVEVTGKPVHHRSWNLSAIWSLPCGESTVWLKCVAPFFVHEAAVLRHLKDEDVPRLIGTDEHRLLLEDLTGEDGYDASVPEHLELIAALVRLQLTTIGSTHELLAAGVPDCRPDALLQELERLVRRRAPGDERLQRLIETAPGRLAALDECGLPEVLVHGDAHPGNCRVGVTSPIWFDWGDSRVGHPLLDMAVLTVNPLADPVRVATVERRWLDLWAEAVPGSDPYRAWNLLRPLAMLRSGAVFQHFLDNIEPSEQIFHDGDVMPALERAAAAFAAETVPPA
jgi:hypothetical protein